MNVVFMGYGLLGAQVLRAVARHHDVPLVLTHRTEFSGLHEPDVLVAAQELGIPVELSARAREPELHQRIRDVGPHVIACTNWRTTVPGEVLRIPLLGAINVHDALLPRYGGFGAVNWVVRNGERTTGLTVHFMDEELDTGPVITQTTVEIGPEDSAGRVLDRLVAEYGPVIVRALDLVESGCRGEPQSGETSFYHRVGLEDTRIDWTRGTTEVYNLVRGQSDPFINAWTTHDGFRLFVKAAAVPTRAYCGTAGRVVKAADGGVAVACGTPASHDARGVILLEVQTEDGPPVRAVDYFLRFGSYVR
jgi:methionyl-tRNA formyltransferase